MSSFFLKGKSKKVLKRKGEKTSKVKVKKPAREHNLENAEEESSDSDLDLKKFSDAEESETEQETAEEKKLRLAKKYLEEIRREEEKRSELKDLDEDAVTARLKLDSLEQQGKLRSLLADQLSAPAAGDLVLVRAREHRLSVTCVCVCSDGAYLYTGSKCSSVLKWSLKEKKKLAALTHKTSKLLRGAITALAITTDSKFLVSSDQSADLNVWDPSKLSHLHTFKGHKDTVTGLVFRRSTHTLYSASMDRSVKVWSLDEMSYVETLFGHQASITSIDAASRERAVTAGGRDSTLRIWKIVEESQLIFNGPQGSVDVVRLLDEEHFVSGSDDGSLCVWSVLKKKPLSSFPEAHGLVNSVPRWITSLATLFNSDVFASGSHDGSIKLWKVCEAYRKILPLFKIDIKGFVNSIEFSPGGRYLYAAVGQEHKGGRWWRDATAKNGILHVNLNLTERK